MSHHSHSRTYPANPMILDLITLYTYNVGEGYKLWSSSLCMFSCPPSCYFLSRKFIYSPQHLFSKHPETDYFP